MHFVHFALLALRCSGSFFALSHCETQQSGFVDTLFQAMARCFGTVVRQHVNPLSRRHLQPIHLEPGWIQQEFDEPDQPFVVDIGCSKGCWTALYAAANRDRNVLGLDIRQPVIDIALSRKRHSKHMTGNLHYLKSNANVDIASILSSIELSTTCGVSLITIQFPDPYFKVRQQKRRLVNDKLVRDIIDTVKPGTKLFLQSDVEELMLSMTEVLQRVGNRLSVVDCNSFSKTELNPPLCNIQTEREASCRRHGLKIYKVMTEVVKN